MSALTHGLYTVSSRHMSGVKIFTTSRHVRRVHCTTLLYNLLPLSPNLHIVDIGLTVTIRIPVIPGAIVDLGTTRDWGGDC